MYNNDWNYVLTFGKYNGKMLKECPETYHQWIIAHATSDSAAGLARQALVRIANRVSVTTVVKQRPPCKLADIKYVENPIATITRPEGANPQLFGAYVEMLIKHAFGTDYLAGVREYLSQFGMCPLPDGLVMAGQFARPRELEQRLHKAMLRGDVRDLPLLSTTHALNVSGVRIGDINEFCNVLTGYQEHMLAFVDFVRATLPALNTDQSKCDKISVGSVIGVMDALRKCDDGTYEIIEIKCCQVDDIQYWYNQTFVYACCYFLRYGDIVSGARVWNFLNGREFYFPFRIDVNIAKRVIRGLSDLREHQEHLA